MTRPDDHIRALAAEIRAAFDAAAVAMAEYEALRPGRKMRAVDGGPTWAEWLATPSGAAYTAHCDTFEAAADRLIDARPETVFGYALKLETLALADLPQEDIDRLTAERRAIIAAAGVWP